MRVFTNKFSRSYIFAVLIFALILSGVCFLFTTPAFVRADSGATRMLPSSALEYKSLVAPDDVYSDDSVTAIIQNPTNQSTSLLVFTNGQFSELSHSALKQVKKLDEQTLLILMNANVYTLDLLTFDLQTLLASDKTPISGNHFDLNSEYLITSFGTNAFVYQKTENGFSKINKDGFQVIDNSPVAINSNADIFYIDNDGFLWCTDVTNSIKTKISNAKVLENALIPSKMIADNQFVYYLINQKICRVSIQNKSILNLLDDGQMQDFDLGNLVTPAGFSFRNGNLLVTDSTLNAVQEFRINDNDLLEFTGFAIAKGKSAYNRVRASSLDKNLKDVEKTGDTVAVLDDEKLLVNTPKNQNAYARENFKNFFKQDLGGQMPNAFALGNGTALLSYNHGDTSGYLRLLNVVSGTLSEKSSLFVGNTIKDVCYQSGYYYVYATSGTSRNEVYKINENDFVIEDAIISTSTTNISAITVDVFANVYLANYDSGEIFICKKNENFKQEKIATLANVYKMATDLGGNLYLLADGKIKLVNDQTLVDLTPTLLSEQDKIQSFAMTFDQKEVALILSGEELVCSTTELSNFSLLDAIVTDDLFKITDSTAQLESFKIAKVEDDANVYSVKRNGESFTYKKLITPEDEYAFVCNVSLSNDLTLCALAGKNGIVLVNSEQITLSAPERDSAPQTAFVSTNVNAYYFPIITANSEYALTDNTQIINVKKTTEIKPLCKITVLDKEFYFANITVNGKNFSAYIPLSFTTETLTEDFKWDDYSLVTLKKTAVFSDSTLKNKICNLESGQKVRLISQENGVACISFSLDGQTFTVGYISTEKIDAPANRAIRNLLIILAVTAAVCGSLSYFLMRKRI